MHEENILPFSAPQVLQLLFVSAGDCSEVIPGVLCLEYGKHHSLLAGVWLKNIPNLELKFHVPLAMISTNFHIDLILWYCTIVPSEKI